MNKTPAVAILAFLVCALVWGHTNALMRVTFAAGYSAPLAVAIQLTIATIVMLIIRRIWAWQVRPTRRQAILAASAGVLSGASFLLQYSASISSSTLTSGLITTILALQPSVVTAVTYLQKRKSTSPWSLANAVTGFMGIYLINRDSAQWSADHALSIILLTAAAIVFALAYFPLDAVEDLNIHTRLTWFIATMTVVAWLGTAFGGAQSVQAATSYAPWVQAGVFIYLGTIGMVLPYYAFLIVLSRWGKTSTVMMEFAIPLVAIFIDLVVVKSSMRIGTPGIIGVVLVLGSILINIRGREPSRLGALASK